MLLPLIGEGRDGECPARDFVVTPASEPESPMNSEGFKLFRPLQSNQLCDSETAALAINGYGYAFHPLLVLFRVTTPHSNSLPIGRENKMFFTTRPTMRFRVAVCGWVSWERPVLFIDKSNPISHNRNMNINTLGLIK